MTSTPPATTRRLKKRVRMKRLAGSDRFITRRSCKPHSGLLRNEEVFSYDKISVRYGIFIQPRISIAIRNVGATRRCQLIGNAPFRESPRNARSPAVRGQLITIPPPPLPDTFEEN